MNRAAQLTLSFLLLYPLSLYPRSPFRTADPKAPQIIAQWKGEENKIIVTDNHFRQYPLFTYGTHDVEKNLIPETIVCTDNQIISKQTLNELINGAIDEVVARKKKVKKAKEIKHFTILQYKNYGFKNMCGLLVLKFKDYPLVLKLFMERPETFLNPYIKGMEPVFFHYMAGGINRHVSGLTRLNNLALIKEVLQSDPLWGPHIDFPRKWFWLPENNKEIILTGKNIADHDLTSTIPSTYAIIADYIDTHDQVDVPIRMRKKLVMQLSNDLQNYIDPHFTNFVFKSAFIDGEETYKIVIIDTEHFPTIVGLEKPREFRNHPSWYAYLGGKCMYDIYGKTKRDLRNQRMNKSMVCLDKPIFKARMNPKELSWLY